MRDLLAEYDLGWVYPDKATFADVLADCPVCGAAIDDTALVTFTKAYVPCHAGIVELPRAQLLSLRPRDPETLRLLDSGALDDHDTAERRRLRGLER